MGDARLDHRLGVVAVTVELGASSFGQEAPDSSVMRMMPSRLMIGISPGITGTVMPAPRAGA